MLPAEGGSSLPTLTHTATPARGSAAPHLCAGLLCVSICDVTSCMFMGRPGEKQPVSLGARWKADPSSQAGKRLKQPRGLTIQGDSIVLLHSFQSICLPLKMHVCCP